jgi:beta-glucanase (GH16 family)
LLAAALAIVLGGFAVVAGGSGAGGATATTTVPTSCGGQQIPRVGGGYLTCTFDEEFTGTTVNTAKWAAPSGADFHSGTECFVPSPQTIGVANGALRLTINKSVKAINCDNRYTNYYSGMLTTAGRFSQTYGRFEIRAMMPTGPALQSALWMYPLHPVGAWPLSGEIDIAELFGKYPGYVLPHLHYLAPNGRQAPGTYCAVANAGTQFHTYAVEWSASTIKFIYDGKPCFSFSGWRPHSPLVAPGPFNQPFYINLTLAMNKQQPWGAAAKTAWPSSMYVDYVRVWH